LGERENKFFKDKENQVYHKFSVVDVGDLPDKFFYSSWRDELNHRDCWLWVSKELIKKFDINWEGDKTYCFLMRLGEYKTASFNIKDKFPNREKVNNMVLKTKEYWENTVQKIGFWGSENYFYEVDKKQKNPSQKQDNNNQSQSENRNFWVKAAWICLPILFFFFCLFLLVKWINKRQK